MEQLKSGDVVQLKSGGPKMTIQRIIGSDRSNFGLIAADEFMKINGYKEGDVVCQWFEGSSLKNGTFKIEGLNKIEA
jgi:uncharacterized protein YodC (DUF2158 family)